MPGFILHSGFGMQCTHLAPCMTVPAQSRVLVSNQPVATVANIINVAPGCPFTVPGPKPQPCVTVRWANVSGRVTASGQPVLLQAGIGMGGGVCQSAEQLPQGPPVVSAVQFRVTAT